MVEGPRRTGVESGSRHLNTYTCALPGDTVYRDAEPMDTLRGDQTDYFPMNCE